MDDGAGRDAGMTAPPVGPIPRRLRKSPTPLTVLQVDPGLRLTSDQVEHLRRQWQEAQRMQRPIVTQGLRVIQFPRGSKVRTL